MRADVVVVGAGPAGSASALLLARAGFDVLLLDRQCFPRAKPCGDCLSPQAARLLQELGVLPAVEACAPARLVGWRIVSPRLSCFEGRFESVAANDPLVSFGFALPRARLDGVLLDAARHAGVRVQTGIRITDLPGPGRVRGHDGAHAPFHAATRLVIGADGLRSAVARRMGVMRQSPRLHKVSLTAHMQGADLAADFGEMHLADGLCAGVAPVSAGSDPVYNVTLVARSDRFGRSIARDAVGFFRTSLERFPKLRGRFTSATFVTEPQGRLLLASGPFDTPTRNTVGTGFALAGDAAGYYDPFTGQGIYQALASAQLLADAASPWLLRAAPLVPPLRDYARKQRALVRGPRLLQRIIEGVISRAALADRIIARLSDRPAVGRALLAATGDLISSWSVFSPAILYRFATPQRSSGSV